MSPRVRREDCLVLSELVYSFEVKPLVDCHGIPNLFDLHLQWCPIYLKFYGSLLWGMITRDIPHFQVIHTSEGSQEFSVEMDWRLNMKCLSPFIMNALYFHIAFQISDPYIHLVSMQQTHKNTQLWTENKLDIFLCLWNPETPGLWSIGRS